MTKKFFLTISFIFLCFISKAQQQQWYNGTYEIFPIEAEITWNADKTIRGSYKVFTKYDTERYEISGTNFVNGKIEITEYLNGIETGHGTLYKKLLKGKIVWSGEIEGLEGSSSSIRLTRSR